MIFCLDASEAIVLNSPSRKDASEAIVLNSLSRKNHLVTRHVWVDSAAQPGTNSVRICGDIVPRCKHIFDSIGIQINHSNRITIYVSM